MTRYVCCASSSLPYRRLQTGRQCLRSFLTCRAWCFPSSPSLNAQPGLLRDGCILFTELGWDWFETFPSAHRRCFVRGAYLRHHDADLLDDLVRASTLPLRMAPDEFDADGRALQRWVAGGCGPR